MKYAYVNADVLVYDTTWTDQAIIDAGGVIIPAPPQNMPYPEWDNTAQQWVDNDIRDYVQKRVDAYPPIPDQLDMIYHDRVNGTDNWQRAISAVKGKYPKT